MASEVVADADAQLTELNRQLIEEARPMYVALNFSRIENIENVPGMALKFSKHPITADAAAITDGTALSNVGINPTAVTITAAGVGRKGVVTDFSDKGSLLTLQESAGNYLRAVINKIDVDTVTNYSNFSTTVGTSAAAMSIANFLSARYNLEANNFYDQAVSVLHPVQWDDMRQAIVAAGGSAFSNPKHSDILSAKDRAHQGEFFGVDVFIDPNVVTTSGDKDGAMYSVGRALVHVWKWLPKAEWIRAPEYPGYTLAVTAAYGTGELNDLGGVLIRTTATA